MTLSPLELELYAAAYDLPPRTDVPSTIKLPGPLKQALSNAMNCEAAIPAEQERLRMLLKEAKSDTEREAREYQIWYVEAYLQRAAKLARERWEHLQTIQTQDDIDAELEKIKNDIHHWFHFYAWGYDPRARTALSEVPFELLPRQSAYIDWLDDLVFRRRSSGIVEKARDEGATETSVRWGTYHWLFTDGFSMLLSTRKEDEVDSKSNQNTLFERIRFQIRRLPAWQWPQKFDVNRSMLGTMKIANPESGNTLIGEAPVENMGRGGRVTVAFLDEPAFWPYGGYPQARSLSQTTDSIIMCSSVAGRLNHYADVAFDGVTPKFVMDWRDNPFKDKRWYNSLPFGYISPKMSRTTIAQEVDRNYDAAQPGKVFSIREEFVFITLDEFLKPFETSKQKHRFFDANGKFKIPDDWRVTRYFDYGQTEGHDWAYSIAAQPSKFYPYNDTVFVFASQNLEPTGLRAEQAVAVWSEIERKLGIRNIKRQFTHEPFGSFCSHEAKDTRKVLLEHYGERWYAWKTDYNTGIEQINDWWTPIEVDLVNPFREKLMGRCRLVFVALEADEYQLAYNERLSQWFVTMSQTEAGFLTLRKQISAYHYPETELGKAVKAMRPVKEFDDIVDTIRALAQEWNRAAAPATVAEAYAEHIATNARGLLPENIANLPNEEDRSLAMAREQFEWDEFQRKQKRSSYVSDGGGINDYLNEVQDGFDNGGFHEL